MHIFKSKKADKPRPIEELMGTCIKHADSFTDRFKFQVRDHEAIRFLWFSLGKWKMGGEKSKTRVKAGEYAVCNM